MPLGNIDAASVAYTNKISDGGLITAVCQVYSRP